MRRLICAFVVCIRNQGPFDYVLGSTMSPAWRLLLNKEYIYDVDESKWSECAHKAVEMSKTAVIAAIINISVSFEDCFALRGSMLLFTFNKHQYCLRRHSRNVVVIGKRYMLIHKHVQRNIIPSIHRGWSGVAKVSCILRHQASNCYWLRVGQDLLSL